MDENPIDATEPVDQESLAAETGSKLSHRRLIWSSLSASAMVVVVVAATLVSSSPPSAAARLDAAISSSLSTTSATFSISGTQEVSGSTVTFAAHGGCDVVSNACAMTDVVPIQGKSETLHIVMATSDAYLEMPGSLSALAGTPWISLPISSTALATALGNMGNPLSGLALAASDGAVVKDLGEVSLNGAAEHQYSVTLDQAAFKKWSSTVKLPSWAPSAVSSVSSSTLTETIDVNSLGRIAQVTKQMDLTVSGRSVTTQSTMVFTAYNVPVTVNVPPASEVTPLSKLLTDLNSASQLTAPAQ